jgi:hypothetical protein
MLNWENKKKKTPTLAYLLSWSYLKNKITVSFHTLMLQSWFIKFLFKPETEYIVFSFHYFADDRLYILCPLFSFEL